MSLGLGVEDLPALLAEQDCSHAAQYTCTAHLDVIDICASGYLASRLVNKMLGSFSAIAKITLTATNKLSGNMNHAFMVELLPFLIAQCQCQVSTAVMNAT